MHIDLHSHTYTYTRIYVELSHCRAMIPLLHNTEKQIKTQYQKWLGSFGVISQWHPTDSPKSSDYCQGSCLHSRMMVKSYYLRHSILNSQNMKTSNWCSPEYHFYYITFVAPEGTLVLFMIPEEKRKHQPEPQFRET